MRPYGIIAASFFTLFFFKRKSSLSSSLLKKVVVSAAAVIEEVRIRSKGQRCCSSFLFVCLAVNLEGNQTEKEESSYIFVSFGLIVIFLLCLFCGGTWWDLLE